MRNTGGKMSQTWEALRPLAFLLRLGREHPSVLWRYFADNLHYTLVKLGILSDEAKHVTEVRAAFETYASQGEFKELFFDTYDINIVLWCVSFSKFFDRADSVNILEIGSWEGRSALFLLTYFTQGRLTAVDTWGGSDEHQNDAARDLQDLEARFDANLSPCVGRLTKRKGASQHVLPQLVDEQQTFDVIYLDGSHFSDDVLTDGINAWRLLKQGGLLIFDDLLWAGYPRARANPVWAVNLFLRYYKGEYDILRVYNQIILQKKVAFADHVTTDFSALQFTTATLETG